MPSSLTAVADAVDGQRIRPATFDRQLREQLGLWQLSEAIPVEEIIYTCQQQSGLVHDDETVLLPLHSKHTAEPTGEYLFYDATTEYLTFYNSAVDRLEQVDIPIGKTIYPAWRLRFWQDTSIPQAAIPRETTTETNTTNPPSSAASTAAEQPTATTIHDELFEDLRAFIERQKEAERRDARGQYQRHPPDEFFATYAGIPSAIPRGREVDDYGQQLVVLAPALDDGGTDDADPDGDESFGLSPDMEVIVDSHGAHEGFPVEAKVLAVSETEVKLGVYWDRSDDKGAAEAAVRQDSEVQFRIAELLNPVTFAREREAINQIEAAEEKRDLLLGRRSPQFNEGQGLPVNEAKLNSHQLNAAKTALRTEDVYCIHGPPGTGKTRTLTELIKAAVDENWRVLACAHSNQAVDNLLVGASTPDRIDPASLHATAEKGEFTMARAGVNSEHPVVQEAYAENDVWKADVVGATTSAAHRFMENEFDLVVVDEASQASIPATLIPYSKAHRLVLAGDHKQLPPYHSGERSDEETIEASLFEHVITQFEADVSTFLRRQYRMHEAIAAFPNRAFYDGKLTHGEENRTRTLGSFPPLEALDVDGEEQQTVTQSYYNELEAKAVARQVSQLLFGGIKPHRIGIITPYSGQIGKIRARLADLKDVDSDVSEVKVATIDSFQGSEKDAIIVSFVRSNPQGYSGFLTFPNEGPRRLNVALTRARRRLVLIGNWQTLATRAPNRSAAESAADTFQDLYDHLQANGVVSQFPQTQ